MDRTHSIFISGLISAILLFAAIARLYHLDFLSMWSDELWVVMDSSVENLDQLISIVYNTETHPPGFHIFLHYWQRIAGNSDFILRLPSAIAGTLLCFVTFKFGKRFLSLEAGLVAAALVAGSYYQIYYSQEVRANILTALFATINLYYFLAIITLQDTRKDYVFFWLSGIALGYLHYAGTVFFLTECFIFFILLITNTKIYSPRLGMTIFAPVLLAYLPWLPGTVHHLLHGPQETWNRVPTTSTLLETVQFFFGPDPIRATLLSCLFLLGLIKISRDAIKKQYRIEQLILIACIIIPIAVFFIKSKVSQPIYNHRHFVYAIALVYLIIADLLFSKKTAANVGENPARIAFIAPILIILVSFILNQYLQMYTSNRFKPEYREASDVVTRDRAFVQQRLSGANVAICSNHRFFNHYLKKYDEHFVSDFIFDNANQLDDFKKILSEKNISEFYYVEGKGPATDLSDNYTSVYEALSTNFSMICKTEFSRTRTMKFRNQSPETDINTLPTCPR